MKELVNIICFFVPLSFGVVCYAALVTGRDLDSEEDHMKQVDKIDNMTIPLVSANFLQLSPMSLHNGLKNNESMVAGMEFMD